MPSSPTHRRMAEFHAISHRQVSESNATPLAAGQALHHAIDRYHLQQFKQILDLLDAYPPINGKSLVDYGVNVHFSDLGSGQHIVTQLPYLYVGGANGKLKTGQYVDGGKTYLSKFLNTIGAAVGCTNAGGQPLDDFNAKTSDGGDNNNYKSRNYCWNYYDSPQPPQPQDGKPRSPAGSTRSSAPDGLSTRRWPLLRRPARRAIDRGQPVRDLRLLRHLGQVL